MNASVIGRDEELAVARALLAGLQEGPRALIIEGEAGIGKTAVWRAALEEAASHGCRVLRCVAEEAEARLSFVCVTDLVGEAADEALPALADPQRHALEVVLRRGTHNSRRAADRRTVGMALRSLLVELARAGPLVVAVDDAQWLDAASMRALAFTARRLDGHRVGVLATVRAPVASPDVLGLTRALGAERSERLRLGPLSLGALGVLLERRLGYRYRRPILLRIQRASAGNPLFALEIARAVGPATDLDAVRPLPVPASLREIVADRIASVSPPARQSLLAAAVLSHPSTELVERVSSRAGLEAAEEAGLLRVDAGDVTFAHPLYAAAVYASAASGRRRAVHRQLAELVADPEERVRHLALATDGRDDEVAAALESGAAHARARGAWETAGELLQQAGALTSREQPELARRRGVRAAELHMRAGDRARAQAMLEEVVRQAPRGSTRSDALRLLAEIQYNEHSFGEAARLFDEALVGLEDRALAVAIDLSLAYVRCNHLGDFAGADVHADRGLVQAKVVGDPALLAEALALRAMVDFMRARRIDWRTVERSLALEDRDRLLSMQLRPSMLAAQLKLGVGELTEARERLTALRTASVDSGHEDELALVLSWLAWLETLAGDFDAAIAYVEDAAQQSALSGSARDRALVLSQRAFVHAHRGDVAATRADASAASEACTELGISEPLLWVAAAHGVLELSLGDAGAAWAALAPLAQRVEVDGIGPVGFVPEALEALIAVGDLDLASRLLERFERRGQELERAWVSASAARCRGLLLAGRGDLDGAQAALDRAREAHEGLELRFGLARTLLVQGQVRRRRRQKRMARESLERALALFEQMGARLWAERARGELARLGSRRAAGELTAAEHRVVELAADGLSNKEIASMLFVSIHTVEAHLSHAYTKLGVRSRSQLAGRLSARA